MGDRKSRHLYVITEESQSIAGGQTMEPSQFNDYIYGSTKPYGVIKGRASANLAGS